MFHRTDFGGFLVCCYKAIQQLNGVEKNYVAIILMLNHNLTGLLFFPALLLRVTLHYPNAWNRLKRWEGYHLPVLHTLHDHLSS